MRHPSQLLVPSRRQFLQSIGLVWYYETSNPTMSFLGRRTLARIAADEGWSLKQTDPHSGDAVRESVAEFR